MAAADGDDSLYPIAVLIDELRNEDVQVGRPRGSWGRWEGGHGSSGRPRGEGLAFAGSGGRGGGQSLSSSHLPGVPDSDDTALVIGREPGQPGWSRAPECARRPGAGERAVREGSACRVGRRRLGDWRRLRNDSRGFGRRVARPAWGRGRLGGRTRVGFLGFGSLASAVWGKKLHK